MGILLNVPQSRWQVNMNNGFWSTQTPKYSPFSPSVEYMQLPGHSPVCFVVYSDFISPGQKELCKIVCTRTSQPYYLRHAPSPMRKLMLIL